MEKTTKFRVETGARLRRLREHLELRQEDLGQIVHMVGTGVSMIEKGQRGLDPEDAVRLKLSTGVTLDWLYSGDAGGLPKDRFKPLMLKSVPAEGRPKRKAAR